MPPQAGALRTVGTRSPETQPRTGCRGAGAAARSSRRPSRRALDASPRRGAMPPRLPGLGGTGRLGSVRPRGRRSRLRGCREPRARRGSRGARGRPWSPMRPAASPRARPEGSRAGATPHHHPWTSRGMQQPICRSGVRAAARNRPDLRTSNSHQAMPRAEAVYAQRREGQTA